MSYTFTADVGDGVKTVFPFSFAGQDTGYLRVTDITVYVAGVSVPFTINLTDPNKVYLTTAPALGSEVLIRRIMPKNVPYSDFARGNPFSQDTLNNTNLQQLYVVQELLDGFLPEGFYFKQDVNMGGHKLVNLGEGTQSGDSVNWNQWENHEGRLDALEGDLTGVSSRTIPYSYIAAGGEVRWQITGFSFNTAMLYINGVFQNQGLGAFTISNNGFDFPEPLVAGDEVYALIGSTVAAPDNDLRGLSTIEAMSLNLSGVRSIKTSSFSGLDYSTKPIGGAEWRLTGLVDLSKASSIVGQYMYDSVGSQFVIVGTRVSPQQLGATATQDASSKLLACFTRGSVFLEGDILITTGLTLVGNNLLLDLAGFDVKCTLPNANTSAFVLSHNSGITIVNGSVTFTTAGKLLFGNASNVLVSGVDFTGGTTAIQLVGTYGDECKNITVTDCTHNGLLPSAGQGGFFSVDAGMYVRIANCSGKGGGEFIDFNNLCSYVWIDNCISENYKQNHWDINSTWHCKVTNSTIISTEAGLTSRPLWVSDSTMGVSWPITAPDRLKNSNYVSFENCTFRVSNMDYTEFMIMNCGIEYNPFTTESRRLNFLMKGCVIDCDGLVYNKDKFKLGVIPDVIQWYLSGNTIKSTGISVVGSGSINGCNFDSGVAGTIGNALDVKLTDGDVSGNIFINWTGTVASSATGGVIFSNTCTRTLFCNNSVKSTVACHAPITSQSGGTNQYIENRFHMVVTDADGVRGNAGDVVVYNGTLSP